MIHKVTPSCHNNIINKEQAVAMASFDFPVDCKESMIVLFVKHIYRKKSPFDFSPTQLYH